MTISKALVLVAVILFVLAALGVAIGGIGTVQIIAAGLAFWAASALVA